MATAALAKLSAALRRPSFAKPRVRFVLLNLLLVATTFAVYWPVHTHGFMQTDDYFYLVDNVHVQHGLDWPTVKWAFTAMNMVNWIPVTWLSHAVDYRLFGADPAGHHLVNVAFHALAALLLFWTLTRATGFIGRSFTVAALFALHPINVEVVAWVAERKTILSMIFLALALAAYRRYAAMPSITRYLLVAALYSLGLMAKSQIIMLPFVLLLWDYWPLQRMFPDGSKVVVGTNSLPPLPPRSFIWLVKEKAPLFALALLDAVVTLHVQGAARPERWKYAFPIRLANAIVAYARYLGKAMWPQWLSISYPHPGNGIPAWQIAGGLALLLAITAAVLAARTERYLAVGWFWFLLSLFPMSGVVHFGDQAMADRYAYQPFCGLFIMICWSAAEWSGRRHLPGPLLAGSSAVLFVLLAASTYRQVNFWRDDLTLWSHSLEVETNNTVAEDRVGGDLLEQGRTAEARQHFARAVSLNPADPVSNLELAFFEHQRGELHEALIHYERVVHAPDVTSEVKRRALVNLGHIYGTLGDAERARTCFDSAAKIPAP
jgi:protein O-mannosyl-transferase